jgi:ribosome-binding factor A
MSGQRKDRVAAAIHQELTSLMQNGMNDPRLGFVTITGVDLSKDMRHARVFVSILGSESARVSSLEALASGAGFLRRELAHRLNLRRTPDLRFHLDVSGERGERIEQLLHDAGMGGRPLNPEHLGNAAPADGPDAPTEEDTPGEEKPDGDDGSS